jgi:hypothetical protein
VVFTSHWDIPAPTIIHGDHRSKTIDGVIVGQIKGDGFIRDQGVGEGNKLGAEGLSQDSGAEA